MPLITDREIVAFFAALYGTGKGQQAANPLFLNLCEGIKPVHDVSRRADLKVGRQLWVRFGVDNRHTVAGMLQGAEIHVATMSGFLNDTNVRDLWDPATEDCWIMDVSGICDQNLPGNLWFSYANLLYHSGEIQGSTALVATDGIGFTALIHVLAAWDMIGPLNPTTFFGGVLLAKNHEPPQARFPLRIDGQQAYLRLFSVAGGLGGSGAFVQVIAQARLWIGPKNHLPPGL